MSIFSAIGSAFKSIGKVGLGVVKGAVNVATTQVGIGQVFTSNGGAPQAAAQSINPNTVPVSNGGTVMASASSLTWGQRLANLGDSLIGFFSGQNHIQVDANVGAGGRVADLPGTGSPFPSWLIPVGLGGLALFLLTRNSGGGGRRRY